MRPALAACAALLVAGVTPAAADAAVRIGATQVVVTAPGGAQATITRAPLRIAFRDARGGSVLRQVAPPALPALAVPPVPDVQYGGRPTPPPALYAPFSFLVGAHRISQVLGTQWTGNLQSVVAGGIAYRARDVVAAAPDGGGVRLAVSTTDPSGRRLVVGVAPGAGGRGLTVSARPSPATGVTAMAGAFASPAGEAFRGFGGRHNELDQRGTTFYNWLQQENLSSGSADAVTRTTDPARDRYLFPNGPHAAYYVQSSFLSSAGFGFLLARDELSHWRMASDRRDAWRAEVAAPGIDYVVVPGSPARAIGPLTALTGRQRVPPAWAIGATIDRQVQLVGETPADYRAAIQDDLREIDRNRIRLSAYRIEGWEFLSDAQLQSVFRQLRARRIKPLVYFREFVGQDEIGTDDPRAYDEALTRGYVATRPGGGPYTFPSNFNRLAAMVDFTKPAAVRWWQGRIRRALDLGAEGFMQDFGEQVQTDMRFADGSTGVAMHNRLANVAARATRQVIDAFERTHRDRRIFFFTRAGYTGTPGATAYEGGNFLGDATTDWTRSAGLAAQAPDMLNRAIGGAFGTLTDIGGYFDVGPYAPTSKELFIRWAQWAALSPFFRIHGSVLNGAHMPWSYDAQTVAEYRRLATLHRRAEPLILRLWRTAARTGVPVTRPQWLTDPGDAVGAREDQSWLLGRDLLVAPVVIEGARSRRVRFPAGCWERGDGASAGRRYRGRTSAMVTAPLLELPWFVRCGTRPFAGGGGGAGGGSGPPPPPGFTGAVQRDAAS